MGEMGWHCFGYLLHTFDPGVLDYTLMISDDVQAAIIETTQDKKPTSVNCKKTIKKRLESEEEAKSTVRFPAG